MQISSSRLAPKLKPNLTGKLADTQPQSTSGTDQDGFSFREPSQNKSSGAKVAYSIAGLAVGASIGAMAGFGTGTLAGVGGAMIAVAPAAFLGGIAGAVLMEQGRNSDASGIVGGGLLGALAGGAVGLAGGAMIGARYSSLGAAVGLGLVGGLNGLLLSGSGR